MNNRDVSRPKSGKNTHGTVESEPCIQRQFLSPRQLAERWDCTPTTAQRIARGAGITKFCLGEGRNGMVRYLLSEVESHEEARRLKDVP